MSFINSQGPLPGIDLSPVDPYMQVTPTGEIPLVCPSTGMRTTEVPLCTRVIVQGTSAHTIMDEAPLTISGPGRGMISSEVCSSSKNVKCSTKLVFQNAPATRALMDPTVQNGKVPNSVGNTVSPSQSKVMNPSA
ncbi:hypothetical protein [Roseibium sediminicola]|uniref:Tox-PAAR-like domain-containing protein n=1 Tax=Roseibium sediminicola TaxID=2933272 RepID=A0ABT0GRG6_9HYPH|nr:hypothetical protein [Roseibium sp. CAU 1639]MCK7611876.1 hypothetical protein [Roseibium sp. CAU 1639]